jgi:hypothetical protein
MAKLRWRLILGLLSLAATVVLTFPAVSPQVGGRVADIWPNGVVTVADVIWPNAPIVADVIWPNGPIVGDNSSDNLDSGN